MPDTPLHRITRTSRRLNLALFGILPIALVLTGALYWGWHRILKQEEYKLKLDFSMLTGYIGAQEALLRKLDAQNQHLKGLEFTPVTQASQAAVPDHPGARFFEGRHALAAMPFSLLCEQPASCPVVGGKIVGIGGYLSDFYSTYWAANYFPAAPVFMTDPAAGVSMSVPAVDAQSGYRPLTQRVFLATADAIRARMSNPGAGRKAAEMPPSAPRQVPDRRVRWFGAPFLPNAMIGAIATVLPSGVQRRDVDAPSTVYAATLLDRDRINLSDKILDTPLYDRFWLSHRDGGVLVGDGAVPDVRAAGLSYTADGMVLKIEDASGIWTGYYRLSYGNFFQANMWLPTGALLLLVFSLAAGAGYRRWYERRVIVPAETAHRDIVESEAFSRTMIETAPVALCVLERANGAVVFGNNLALQWLGVGVGQVLLASPATERLLREVLGATRPGTIEAFRAHDGRPLFVAYAPTRYKQKNVVLCAFADISARAEMERTLAQAKLEAEKANEAKSTFLATMSHEIRTPLYGVLGTLEVLGMTELSAEQRQHVERIQNSSIILQQLISDILDITKIEADQLALEPAPFNPRELVQSCTSSYAGMAAQKALLLYCCVDTSVPEWVDGDAGRIRQILGNLLSNAIKFTESGHVIVRAHATEMPGNEVRLSLQVADSGIGIGEDDRVQLFDPFFQIDGGRHTVRGAGIGLSICARLAKLMGGTIQVTSELGLGSSFSLGLALKRVAGQPAPAPALQGIHVHVRSPRKDLSENIARWLAHWGAHATPTAAASPAGGRHEVLVDVLLDGNVKPIEWAGQYMAIGTPGSLAGIGHGEVDGHSVDSIGFAIQRLVRGERGLPPASSPGAVFAPLGLRVLVAEDNPINQVTLRDQLEQLGCAVTLAADGAEALALWSLAPFDLLLTDVNMPKMNGYELAVALRAQGVSAPVIGVTANAMREEEARCEAAGMTAWLVKPIELRTLWRHLHRFAHPAPAPDARPGPDAGMAASRADDTQAVQDAHDAPIVLPKYRALFLETMRSDLDKFEQAIVQGDETQLRHTVHRMSGGLAVVKIGDLALRTEKLEIRLRSEGLSAAVAGDADILARDLRTLLTRV